MTEELKECRGSIVDRLGEYIEYADKTKRFADVAFYKEVIEHIGKEAASRTAPDWLPYPDHAPRNGWCATTDGGDISLEFWRDGKWEAGDRGIVEFMQVTVDVSPNEGIGDGRGNKPKVGNPTQR